MNLHLIPQLNTSLEESHFVLTTPQPFELEAANLWLLSQMKGDVNAFVILTMTFAIFAAPSCNIPSVLSRFKLRQWRAQWTMFWKSWMICWLSSKMLLFVQSISEFWIREVAWPSTQRCRNLRQFAISLLKWDTMNFCQTSFNNLDWEGFVIKKMYKLFVTRFVPFNYMISTKWQKPTLFFIASWVSICRKFEILQVIRCQKFLERALRERYLTSFPISEHTRSDIKTFWFRDCRLTAEIVCRDQCFKLQVLLRDKEYLLRHSS